MGRETQPPPTFTGAPVAWPADDVQRRPIEALVPYARNARKHSEAQISQIAGSMREWGWTNPVLVDEQGGIIAGHGRVLAARQLGFAEVPVMVAAGWSEAQKRAYIIADNKLALNADWDLDLLAVELADLDAAGFDLDLTGFSADELDRLLHEDETEETTEGLTPDDEIPDVRSDAVSVAGDVWQLGKHRAMCGDSTSAADVEKLMAGATAQLLHADPPYGMGKEADGVAGDNVYAENLDRFQMSWWTAIRTVLHDKASAYIWGNAPDLWRLWYAGGLGDSERLELRNEIVWDKRSIPGMASSAMLEYPTATERCLFFQLGQQFLGAVNAEDFPGSWEPIRGYLESQAQAAGVTSAEVMRVCRVGMYAHWFSRSQFILIPQEHYRKLASAFPGHFERPWRELQAEWARVSVRTRDARMAGLARSYFDNAHDVMRDVWEFPRVFGTERHGHATPKPVAMMERVMKSSLPAGGLVVEPFGGSGSTLIGAEKTGRVCSTMEMQPHYVDVIVRRWQAFTGKVATLEATGRTFAETATDRSTGAGDFPS